MAENDKIIQEFTSGEYKEGFETDQNNCPDLFPIVAVLAAFCPGESRIRGVQRLLHKETDRAAAIVLADLIDLA